MIVDFKGIQPTVSHHITPPLCTLAYFLWLWTLLKSRFVVFPSRWSRRPDSSSSPFHSATTLVSTTALTVRSPPTLPPRGGLTTANGQLWYTTTSSGPPVNELDLHGKASGHKYFDIWIILISFLFSLLVQDILFCSVLDCSASYCAKI